MKIAEYRNYIRLFTFGVVGILSLVLSISTRAQSPTTAVVGIVLDAQTGRAIANTSILVTGIGSTRATADATGSFIVSDIPVTEPFTQVTIKITAPGYGSWTMRDTPLYPSITRTIRVSLLQQDQLMVDSLPRALTGGTQLPIDLTRIPHAPQYFSNTVPPSTIKVGITGYTGCQAWLDAGQPVIRVDTIDFREYVKNVLPHEWIASWGNNAPNSLRAGAMAVKMFAWWRVNLGGVRPMGAEVVDNTCDQVYLPNTNDYRTDAAVDLTWFYRMRKNGQVIEIHYVATDCPPEWRCMSQWGTYYRALEGLDWQAIVHYYYDYINSAYDPVQIDTFGNWYFFPMMFR